MAALLALAGVTHFVVPHWYDAIVPRALPGPARAWTLGSGAAELACASALALPSTRRAGAWAALVLLVAVFPANVQMAIDWQDEPAARRAVSLLRLPLQLPLLVWAWSVARSGGRRSEGRGGGGDVAGQRTR